MEDDYVIIPDHLFINAFDNIPALFFNRIEYGDNNNILMNDALNIGLIDKVLNTFELIKFIYPTFNPERIDAKYNFIITYNTYDFNSIEKLQNNDLIKDIEDESRVIRAIRYAIDIILSESLSPSLYQLITTLIYKMNKKNRYELVPSADYRLALETLIVDHWIHLLYAIIIQDIDLVKQILYQVDPRINNNEAYHLALLLKNDEIIDIIRDTIIRRRWIEQLAIDKSFTSILGPSDIPQSLFGYPNIYL